MLRHVRLTTLPAWPGRVLLVLLMCLGLVVGFAPTAHADRLPGAFTDDDFSKVDDRSPNMGVDTSTDEAFSSDPTVMTRDSAEQGWVEWQTDAPITQVSVNLYQWSHAENAKTRLLTSADGKTWTEATAVTSSTPNADASDWPRLTMEATISTLDQHWLRIELTGTADGGGWGTQLARVYVNSRVAMVRATPPAPAKLAGPTAITLTTATPGATIRYTINDGEPTTYSAPFTISDKSQVVAWATKDGLADSARSTFNYATRADEIVDRYGQVIAADFPGKVTSDKQLRADVRADDRYYDSLRPPRRDPYGGDRSTRGRLGMERTGWFHVDKTRGGRTTLVDPAGNQFFSTGLNVFGSVGDTYTQVSGREEKYEYLPPATGDLLSAGWMGEATDNYSFYIANQVRKYGKWNTGEYWQRQVERANALGFNTVGGFSNLTERKRAPKPYVAHLDDVPSHDIGDSGIYDVYADGLQAELDKSMANQTKPYRDDPYLVGYMFFNEIPWSKLRTAVPGAKASEVGSKAALVDLLEKRHHHSIASFNQAWAMDAASFDALRELEFTPKTDAAVADMDAFSEQFMDRFYAVFSRSIRKADPHHLVLGDRWFGSVIANDKLRAQLATAAGKHLDVITYNYYTWDLDTSRLEEIHKLSGGLPIILTEFHYGEPSHGLTFAIRMAANEDEKGRLYRNYVEKAAATGFVVGAHWFEYLDQAATGRWFQGTDGEAGGIGLLDVTDRPYKTMLSHVTRTNYQIYDVAEGKRVPYHYAFKPGQVERESHNTTQIPKASAPITVDGTLDAQWPDGPSIELGSKDLTDGVSLDGVEGSFRWSWDAENLYLHATIADPTPMKNQFHGFDIWNGDAIEIFVGPRNVDQGGAIQVADNQIIINAQPQDSSGRAEAFWYNDRTDQPPIDAVVKAAEGGYTVEAAIKLSDLNVGTVTPPQDLRFDFGFDDGNGRSRQRQYLWNGVEDNAHNREAWGRATMVDAWTPGEGEGPGEQLPLSVTIKSPRTPVDGQLFFTGTGPAGTELVVELDGTRIGTITVGDTGRFDTTVDLPPRTRPGRHSVVVRHDASIVARASIILTRSS